MGIHSLFSLLLLVVLLSGCAINPVTGKSELALYSMPENEGQRAPVLGGMSWAMRTALGAHRIVDMPVGEQLPVIC
ncbi:MAG: hypothetical protein ACYDHV_10795 [Desulfurivibrionaceae bacterium]|jgi:uncharacterized protein YceK